MTILKTLFKFVEASDWQVEDDMYELKSNPNVYIQCLQEGGYSVNVATENPFSVTFGKVFDELDLAMYEAVSI